MSNAPQTIWRFQVAGFLVPKNCRLGEVPTRQDVDDLMVHVADCGGVDNDVDDDELDPDIIDGCAVSGGRRSDQ